MCSVAEKIGRFRRDARRWVRQAERDEGKREGLTTSEHEEFKRLQRENRELRRMAREDGGTRVAIEGKFGDAKRSYPPIPYA